MSIGKLAFVAALLLAQSILGLDLSVQRRDASSNAKITERFTFDPAKTAVVVIDMWDSHWCKTYTERVANLVPRMNETLAAARKLGLQVIWAPSDVLDFYKDVPQRRAMTSIPSHPEPKRNGFNPPQVPQGDNCECGPDRPCKSRKTWTRQNADLRIEPNDLIADCNNARETLNLCAEREIDTLIYMGVASNMCICYRSLGMVNMLQRGLRTVFVSDLVQSIMGNGFNPATREVDPTFTPAKGSAIVQRALERDVAPSFESRQLLELAGKERGKPHVVFVLGDEEYKTGETLPAWANTALATNYKLTFLHANPTNRNDVPGLDALYDANALVLSMRRRFLPVTQMDHLERFIRAEKPLLAIRVSSAPFAEGAGLKRTGNGLVVWQNFDQEALGCRYNYYDSAARQTGSDVWTISSAASHPMMRGVEPLKFHTTAWIYKVRPLADDTTMLLEGRWTQDQPSEPVAWVREKNGRVFYTSLGHENDFNNPAFTTMLANAVHWALRE